MKRGRVSQGSMEDRDLMSHLHRAGASRHGLKPTEGDDNPSTERVRRTNRPSGRNFFTLRPMVVQCPDELMKFLNVSDFEPVKPLRSYLRSIREHSMHCMAFECT